MEDKIKSIIVTIIFSLFLFTFLFLNLIKKDDVISVSERRLLARMPKLSAKKVFDGSFFEGFDAYTTDQFIKRDDFRKIKADLELLTKKNYNNLYVYNDYIIKQMYPLDEKSVLRVIDKINYIKENYLKDNKIYFSIIPDKNYYVSNGNLKLDYKKMEDIMKNNLEYAKYIDMFSLLSLDNYYKTDTHWKEETLINVANSLSKNMNFNLSNTYNSETLSSFKGVYKGQLPINISNDNIVILTNDTIKNSKVYNYEDNSVGDVYNISKLSGLDKYDIYLSGASSLLTITNKQNNTNRELIVFRDSYASSLIPLIIEGYRKITLVDTRYISPKILDNYIDFDNQDIYFLYSALLINDSYSMK